MVSLVVKEVICLVYSVLLFLSGLLLVGFSVVLSYKIFYNYKFFPSAAVAPFILLLFVGIIHLLVTWLAFKGPTVKHDFHIIMFLVITAVLFVTEFGIGIWNIILWNNIDLESVILLTQSFEEVTRNKLHQSSAWNRLQDKLKCCGLNGLKDFQFSTGSHPVFCCDTQQGSNRTCFDIGCRQPLADYAKGLMLDGILMSVLSGSLQALGVFLYWSFYKTLKSDRKIKSARRLALQKELIEHGEQTTPLTQSPLKTTPEKNETSKYSKKKSPKATAPLAPPQADEIC